MGEHPTTSVAFLLLRAAFRLCDALASFLLGSIGVLGHLGLVLGVIARTQRARRGKHDLHTSKCSHHLSTPKLNPIGHERVAPRLYTPAAQQQREHCADQEDEKQNLGNARSAGGDSKEAERSGNKRNDEKYSCIIKHVALA